MPNDRIAHQLRDAFRAMARTMRDRLAGSGIPYGFWTFLRILWERDGITQRDLSVMAGVKDSSTHSALVAMEKAGLVLRVKLPENKRSVCIYVTPKGRKLQRQLIPLAEQVNAEALRGIPEDQARVFRSVLRAIVENLGSASEEDAAEEPVELPVGKPQKVKVARPVPAARPAKAKAPKAVKSVKAVKAPKAVKAVKAPKAVKAEAAKGARLQKVKDAQADKNAKVRRAGSRLRA